jgi:RecB family endonuclease NucS
MKQIKTEKQLQKYLVENFPLYFDSQLFAEQFILPNGKFIDLIGDKDNIHYIIEVKKNWADSKTVWQVFDYVDAYKLIPGNETLKVIGIVTAPKIKPEVYDIVTRLDFIKAVEITGVEYYNQRHKFTTTLQEDTIEKMKLLCHYYKLDSLNDLIEKMVEKAWEEMKNEMDTKNRDNGRSS